MWHCPLPGFLDGELLTRSVAIDGSPIPSLEVTVAYEELDGANAAVDQMIAEIGGRVIRRISELSPS